MNKERVEQAIAIMKRAGRVYMAYFHSRPHDERDVLLRGCKYQTTDLGGTEEELHQCGAAACFAGWVSVSPEFKAAGGRPGTGGAPHFPVPGDTNGEVEGSDAIAKWLEISPVLASGLVYNEPQHGVWPTFYDKPLEDVTREDVLAKLEAILAGELR